MARNGPLCPRQQRNRVTKDTMSAKELIQIAASKGIGISREKSGVYKTHEVINEKHVTKKFIGTWAQFVKHVKAL